MSKQRTAGELRELLFNAIEEVSTGKLKVERAAVIVKAAGQINESIYAELKTVALQRMLSSEAVNLGQSQIGMATPLLDAPE